MKSIKLTGRNRRIIAAAIAICLVIAMLACTITTAFADETKILTLGQDLTDEQKQLVIDYLGVGTNQVDVITVNNMDEHEYLDNVISEQKIGTKTYSCCYIEPTSEGGIHIKTVNLTYVDSDMIRNALITSGINNANVICVSPKPVSGTGALVGVFKAYEQITGDSMDEEKMELASEELVTTVELSEEVGKEEASDMMNELKQQVIEDADELDRDKILDLIDNYVTEHQLNLTEDQKWKIVDILLKIAQQDYDIEEVKQSYYDTKQKIEDIKETADEAKNIIEKIGDFLKELWQKITGTYEQVKADERVQMIKDEIGILAQTNDELLGDSTVVTNTEDTEIMNELKNATNVSSIDKEGFWDSIVNFFKDLFSKDENTEENNDEQTENQETDGITFDSFDNSSEEPVEDEEITVDFDETSDENDESKNNESVEEQSEGNLDYVTYELQDLDPSNQESQQTDEAPVDDSYNNTKSFDELTQ